MEQYLRLPTAVYGERGAQVAEALPGWSEAVFGAIFSSESARDAYAQARARAQGDPVEIVLRSQSAEQLGRPWELMAAPGRHLAVTRMLPSDAGEDSFDVPGARFRVLMVISRPAGANDVGYQMIARPLLQRLKEVRDHVELVVLRPPTLRRLDQVLTEAREAGTPFQVVHFDGHGSYGPVPTTSGSAERGAGTREAHDSQGMLAFEDASGDSDLVESGQVALVLAGAKVPLVVVNACQSAQVGSQVEATVATRLLAEGCSNVVAMAYSVYAVAAAEFMTAFYERLFAGDRITAAVAAGRHRLAQSDKRPSLEGDLPLADWMVPVLYTRGETRFPDLRTSRTPQKKVTEVSARTRGLTDQRASDSGIGLKSEGKFVGRDADIYTLEAATRLRRVVVLHGPAGTGKTELAKALGRWWRDSDGVDSLEGVIWHSFEPGVASFGLDGLIDAVGARVLEGEFTFLDTAQRQTAVEKILAARRLLLIFDNFESVHDMPDPGHATMPLSQQEQDKMHEFLNRLAAGGRSTVVITSRSPENWLGLGVGRVELGSLNIADAAAYADWLLAPYPAAREHRHNPAFADLMRWLAGHPLTMRLALPHLNDKDATVLLSELKSAKLLPDDGITDHRNASLAASLSYSLRHLAPADQEALTVLSLFQGATHVDVLARLSADARTPQRFRGRTGPQWTELMQRAVDLGVLTSLDADVFGLHPVLPAHLAARWATGRPVEYALERRAANRALLSAHAALSTELTRELADRNADLAMTSVEHQRRTLGVMLDYALTKGQWGEALDLVRPLDKYWTARGLREEAQSWTGRVRKAVETADGNPPALNTLANDLWLFVTVAQANRLLAHGDSIRAGDTYRDIMNTWRQQPSSPDQQHFIAVLSHQLGVANQREGRLTEAETWYRESLTIKRELRNYPGIALTQHQLGMVAWETGQWTEAEEWYRKSLAINEGLGDLPRASTTYHQLGIVMAGTERLAEAETWYLKSLAISRKLGNHGAKAMTYHELGRLAQRKRRPALAVEWYHKSLAINETLKNGPGRALTYRQLGELARESGRPEEATRWYRHSLAINENLRDRHGTAVDFHHLGQVAREEGRLAEAETWHGKSLAINEELDHRLDMSACYREMALLAEAQEDRIAALTWLVKCVSQFEEFPHPAAGTGPHHLRRLTAQLGVPALERAWQDVLGAPLPSAVHAYITHDSPS
ncbi:hypothetical protein BGM09_30690 [Streptomyces sp. CBMA29]|nr:hypothetical protein [Streptomyces sp. CBMA29]